MKRSQSTCTRKPDYFASLALIILCLVSKVTSNADIIYVSNRNMGNIQKFDSVTGRDLGVFVDNLTDPSGIALDKAGNLYVFVWGSSSIMKYTPEGVASVFATGLQGPESLAFDSAGNLYVGNKWDNAIMKFTPGGIGFVFASSGLIDPNGMAFDRAGNLYVANSPGNIYLPNGSANTIQKFTPEGVRSVFATGLKNPTGLAFDGAGNLFVSNYEGHYYQSPSIQKFTPQGVSSVFVTGGLADPAGIAFDSAGNLFVADQWGGPNNGRIVKYDQRGVGSVFADIYFGGPMYIAIQVVPEPSMIAVLAVGPLSFLAIRRRCRPSKEETLS